MATKVLFLYSELAGYLLSSLKAWSDTGREAVILHWPVNPEAPFQIPEIKGVEFIERSQCAEVEDIVRLIQSEDFDAVLCSGWIDKDYLRALRASGFQGARVLLMDTWWIGSLKQRLATIFLAPLLRKTYSHAWVAGAPQRRYAERLGFASSHIKEGFYTADTQLFGSIPARVDEGDSGYPKTFLYLGRYVEHKGIFDLWEAFVRANDKVSENWKLICVGTGDRFDDRRIHPAIEHLGFLQPKELIPVINRSGVFILPSHFEPWGVVVHEMAAAGLPLLVSDKVGAASRFVQEGENGFYFEAGNVDSLEQRILQTMELSDKELEQMSAQSRRSAATLTEALWVEQLCELL